MNLEKTSAERQDELVIGHQDLVQIESDSGIATLTLNRPTRLNGWTPAMESRFLELTDEATRDSSVKVIIVTGSGRAFCAGADLDDLQIAGRQTASPIADHILGIPKPTIAAINGPCAGIGFVIAMMCDLRFVAAGAKLTTSFVRRGLVAESGISWLLPRLIGLTHSMDLLLSGRVISAEEAAAMGLVNRVIAREAFRDEVTAYARDLVDNCSPASMAVIKRQLHRHLNASFGQSVEESAQLLEDALARIDSEEGIASFLERRQPHFPNLNLSQVRIPPLEG